MRYISLLVYKLVCPVLNYIHLAFIHQKHPELNLNPETIKTVADQCRLGL